MALRYKESFFESLSLKGAYSPHTVSAYHRDLNLYQQFLKTKKEIGAFYEYMSHQGLSPRSKARVISSVRSYLKFLEAKGKKTPLQKLGSVPVRMGLPKPVSFKDFKKLHRASIVKGGESKTIRNQVTLLLLFGLGCRISEVLGIRLQDIKETESAVVVTGKRGKQRLLPLTRDLLKALTNYRKNHRPLLLKNHKTPFLLINDRGRPPSRVDVWRWLKLWSTKAGFCEVKSPHQFRHGFATGLLENGADLRSIQILLGHSSIQTTQIYTSVRKTHLQKMIKKHHPLSGGLKKKPPPSYR